jgi:hypothetical protein
MAWDLPNKRNIILSSKRLDLPITLGILTEPVTIKE